MKLTRRYHPAPPYAYCRRCPWTDPDGRDRPRTRGPFGVTVEQAARGHVTVTGHEVRLVRVQEVILRPGQEVACDA
jgi:hypothetical protein